MTEAQLPSWDGLFAQYADRRDLMAENLASDVEDLAGAADELVTSRFEGVEEAFARYVLLFGPDPLGEVGPGLAGQADRAAAVLDRRGVSDDETAYDAVTLLLLLVALRATGLRDGPDDTERASRWLAGVARSAPDDDEELRRRGAFAALGFGLADLVVELAGTDPVEPFQPGRSFGPDLTGFLRYAAGAVHAQADVEGAVPAWQDVLDGFPLKLASGTMTWAELVAAWRAIHVLLDARAERALVERLRSEVT